RAADAQTRDSRCRLPARLHSPHAAADADASGAVEYVRLRWQQRLSLVPAGMTRIAITGIGVVAPGAIGIAPFAAVLDRGATLATPIDRFDTSGLSAHTAAVVRDFVPRDFIAPLKLRRMNALSRFGVAAARLAIADRGSDLSPAAGVAIGTAFG